MRVRNTLSVLVAVCLIVPDANAQSAGNCEIGVAAADLDVNNVRARLYNNGGLFWRGSGNVYTVPKEGQANAIFSSTIWIGGLANGEEMRFAGSTYGPWEFWPGPLDDAGNPPSSCEQYDHLYSVYREDVERFLQGGPTTADIVNWPGDLGAPYVDVNDDGAYDPGDGDHPEVVGDQTVWWVMNDVGGQKEWSETAPIGLEIQVTAFAFESGDALNDATFYSYKIIHKGDDPLSDAYLGLNVDPDLGNATDDFVGSDTTLGLGFAYNGEDFDHGIDGYGERPAAIGYDFFQGPLVRAPGERWIDPDGTVHEDSTRLKMSHFVYYDGDFTAMGDPDETSAYKYLRGIWRDGTPLTFGGTGYGGTEPADYMYPGDPVTREYWSEENIDGNGTRNHPSDRRFLISTGPFTLRPGDVQEIVFGIVWARSPDRLASVAQLRLADQRAQSLFEADFRRTPLPDAPVVTAEPMAGAVGLSWSNPEASNNYLNAYDALSSYLVEEDAVDTTYTFEGYNVFRYASSSDEEGELIGTYDIKNGLTRIRDEVIDPVSGFPEFGLVARGSDTGIQNHFVVDNLTNFQTYYFGIQAYAYNEHSRPRVIAGEIRRISGMPADPDQQGVTVPAAPGDTISSIRLAGTGAAEDVFATITNPRRLTGHTYEVRFFDSDAGVAYDIMDVETGEVKLDGRSYIAERGEQQPHGVSIATIDGISYTIMRREADIETMEVVETASGPVQDDNVWHALDNQASFYLSSTGSGRKEVVTQHVEHAAPRDFELRFTEEGGYGVYAFEDQIIATTPFELWDIGAGTPDDPTDDIRMIPLLQSADSTTRGEWGWAVGTDAYFGYPSSDAIFFADPDGGDGYARFAEHAAATGVGNPYPVDSDGSSNGYWANLHGNFVTPISGVVLGDYNRSGGPPPPGTVIRFTTTKPFSDGDAFAINTEAYAPHVSEDSARAAIENIGIVPNPYRGTSTYEVHNSADEVRFTNLHDRSIVRVFSLSGDLVRMMELSTTNNSWDLRNDEGHHVASGMYLIHVEVPGIGEKILKFGVVKKRLAD